MGGSEATEEAPLKETLGCFSLLCLYFLATTRWAVIPGYTRSHSALPHWRSKAIKPLDHGQKPLKPWTETNNPLLNLILGTLKEQIAPQDGTSPVNFGRGLRMAVWRKDGWKRRGQSRSTGICAQLGAWKESRQSYDADVRSLAVLHGRDECAMWIRLTQQVWHRGQWCPGLLTTMHAPFTTPSWNSGCRSPSEGKNSSATFLALDCPTTGAGRVCLLSMPFCLRVCSRWFL